MRLINTDRPLSGSEQFAILNERCYTREEFTAWIARTPWYEPKPIMCVQCSTYHSMVYPARMQVHGLWLCLIHLLERGVSVV